MAHTQRPPYHYQEGDHPLPKGLMADILIRALYHARIEVNFQVMPARRIMIQTQKEKPFCSFTWFKTESRAQFATFTEPLWTDRPFQVVTHRSHQEQLERFSTFDQLLTESKLVLGTRRNMSYGNQLDKRLNREGNSVEIHKAVNNQVNMAKMLARRRFDFMLMTPAELPGVFEAAGIPRSKYVALEFPDIPNGEKRRVMCNKAVEDSLIERLNQSIRKFSGP
ncbi:hypothetical protein ACMDCT_08035 [Halomonadaceae bacterium KBTZ08]